MFKNELKSSSECDEITVLTPSSCIAEESTHVNVPTSLDIVSLYLKR